MLNSFAETSRVTYLSELGLFAEFLGAKPLSEARSEDAMLYLSHLHERRVADRPLANKTIRRKIDSLVSMYDGAIDFGGITENPFIRAVRHVRRLRKEYKREPRHVEFDEVLEILKRTDSIRNRAIFAILFGGGLRRSELAILRRVDVEILSDGRVGLRVQCSKKHIAKVRPVTLPTWASAYVVDYLEKSIKLEYLFSTVEAGVERHINPKRISDLCFNAFGMRAHSCRHTFVSYLLSRGVPLYDVARAVGHEHISSTLVYDRRRIDFSTSVASQADFCGDKRNLIEGTEKIRY